MATQLESLSNELLLDIMEYLDGYLLIKAFHGLNYRFNSLLRLCRVDLYMDEVKHNDKQWNQSITFFEPSQIRSFEYEDDYYGNNSNYNVLQNYSNLRSLFLSGMTDCKMDDLLGHYLVLNQVNNLRIETQYCNCENPDAPHSVFDIIFNKYGSCFTSIVNCLLTYSYGIQEFPIISNIFPHLRRLALSNVTISSNLIRFLRENTPNLRSLDISRYNYALDDFQSSDVIKHVYEHSIWYYGDQPELGRYLLLFPSLKRLYIRLDYSSNIPILDGSGWQKILENHLHDIQHLTIDFNNHAPEEIGKTFYTNEYWLKKKVVVKVFTDKNRRRYISTICFGSHWRPLFSESMYLFYYSW